jgi:hypothetical protein
LSKEMTWSEWEAKYKPIANHLVKSPDQLMFETYGEEVEFVKTKIDTNQVWTYVDGDMSSLIMAGFGIVNRIGYYVTEIPWEDSMDYVLLSEEEECVCYDEESGEGKEDCTECEGYGLVTKYVD